MATPRVKHPWPICPEHHEKMLWHEDQLFVCPYIGISCGWYMEGRREDFDEDNPETVKEL